MWKRHQGARQDVCILTETNSVGDGKLNALVAHAESPKELLAWELNPRQQAIDEKTKRFIQFIDDISYKPLQIYQNSLFQKKTSNITSISSQTEDQEMVFISEGRKNDGRMLWIGIIAGIVALTFLIAVYMKMKG
jgi:hypothetical protein